MNVGQTNILSLWLTNLLPNLLLRILITISFPWFMPLKKTGPPWQTARLPQRHGDLRLSVPAWRRVWLYRVCSWQYLNRLFILRWIPLIWFSSRKIGNLFKIKFNGARITVSCQHQASGKEKARIGPKQDGLQHRSDRIGRLFNLAAKHLVCRIKKAIPDGVAKSWDTGGDGHSDKRQQQGILHRRRAGLIAGKLHNQVHDGFLPVGHETTGFSRSWFDSWLNGHS